MKRVFAAGFALVKGGALLMAAIGGAALVYEQAGTWRDGRVLRQVGRFVDIGGRRLNISCLGEGSPTVIFAAGRDAPGYEWLPSQRGVAAFTRACWYDRAGLGWSDPGPDPAWGDRAASDLHQLVLNAPLTPPFVLVGASFGGYIIRIYNDAYPGEVEGMIFADTALEDAGRIAGLPHRDPPKLPRAAIRGLSVVLGRFGMMRMIAAPPGRPPKGWTAQEWDVFARLSRQRKVLLADAQEGPEAATADIVRRTRGLDDMPMIVLTQGRPIRDAGSPEAQVRRGWVELQREFAQRSTRGRQILVANSGHGIPLEAPDAVISAVRELVTAVKARQPRTAPGP